MKKELNIFGIGEALYDIFPEGKQLGGAPINFAYHAKQLEANGKIITSIGDDQIGKDLVNEINNLGIRNFISYSEFPTGTVAVTVDDKGLPSYEICEPVAWDEIKINKETEEALVNADALCFGTLAQRNDVSRKAIEQVLNTVPKECIKVFDINLRQHYYNKDCIESSLNQCNVLKINEEEVLVVAELLDVNLLDEEQFCHHLIERFSIDMVALTKGEEGSYLVTKNETSYLSTPKVNVVDTVGAGDSFTARLVIGILNNEPIIETHQKAVELSAYVCTQKGATPKIDKISQ
ncbi:carbohydrate kinase family protein [Flammeovirga agarivorans]|uniref:Carbohydrate kinase n=1 Tax=Flammeovirga agarivorans TaxID=2726742 RepID=A0A7X8SL34_9BACT|nr:carbohydrate kinase [Flammeovirga agarivorans]NLR92108.1 carbohydrate kinase [Flammeovirga agarivorans]